VRSEGLGVQRAGLEGKRAQRQGQACGLWVEAWAAFGLESRVTQYQSHCLWPNSHLYPQLHLCWEADCTASQHQLRLCL
jgi:hypothetical protein